MSYDALLAALQEEQQRITLDRAHRYRRDKKHAPGVTTIIKVMDAPFLDQWKVRVQVEGTARAAHANPPMPDEDVERYVGRLVAAAETQYEHERISAEAADVGKGAHKLIEHAIKGMLGQDVPMPDVPDESRFAFAGWREWAKDADFRPLFTEARVYHPLHHYCGTVDAGALVEGRPAIVDWKPKDTIYAERRLQLTAYAKPLEHAGWPPLDRYVVALPRDGGPISMVKLDDDPEDTFAAFLHCLGLYRWQASLRSNARSKAA